MEKKRKKEYKSYPDKFKQQLIDECEHGSVYRVAKRHGIAQATLRTWVRQHSALLDKAKSIGVAIPKQETYDAVTVEQTITDEIEDILLVRIKFLASTTKRLGEAIEALKYMDARKVLETNGGDTSNLNAFLEKLIKKSKV